MYYWIIYNTTTGEIGGSSGTHAPDSTMAPAGFSLVGPYDDDANPMPTDFQAAYDNPQAYLYQNNAFVANPNYSTIQLATTKQVQIASLRQGYTQTLSGGFLATIGTTQYTFGWSTDDKTNMLATQEAITGALMAFPVQYSDIYGNPVAIPDQTTLTSLKSTATSFFNTQHQQILTLIGQVNAATTVADVQAIVWTEATY